MTWVSILLLGHTCAHDYVRHDFSCFCFLFFFLFVLQVFVVCMVGAVMLIYDSISPPSPSQRALSCCFIRHSAAVEQFPVIKPRDKWKLVAVFYHQTQRIMCYCPSPPKSLWEKWSQFQDPRPARTAARRQRPLMRLWLLVGYFHDQFSNWGVISFSSSFVFFLLHTQATATYSLASII